MSAAIVDVTNEFVAVSKTAKRKRNQRTGDSVSSQKMQIEDSAADDNSRPAYPPVKREKLDNKVEIRKVSVPAHRYSPLKENWMKLFSPIVEHLHLQIRFNLKNRQVEIRTCEATEDIGKVFYCSLKN